MGSMGKPWSPHEFHAFPHASYTRELYPRFISDKEIVAHSGFLNPAFWEAGDSVMADRGFNIQDALKELGVELNIPAFLDGHDQLEEEEVIERNYCFS